MSTHGDNVLMIRNQKNKNRVQVPGAGVEPAYSLKILIKLTMDKELISLIYVINLPRSRERRRRMKRRLEGLKNVFWYPTIPAEEETRITEEERKTLRPNDLRVIANGLTHEDIWRDAEIRGYGNILVLEDDVLFHKDWLRLTLDSLRKLEETDRNWHMFMLNCGGFIQYDVEGLRKIPLHARMLLAGAYVLSPSGRKQLLRMTFPRSMASDYRLMELQNFERSYFHFPMLAHQENLDSDINGDAGLRWCREQQDWLEKNFLPTYGHLYEKWPAFKIQTPKSANLKETKTSFS